MITFRDNMFYSAHFISFQLLHPSLDILFFFVKHHVNSAQRIQYTLGK